MPTEGTGEPPKSFGGRPPEVSLLWFPRGGAEGHFHSYRPLPGLGLWERDREGGTLPSSLSAGSGLLSSQALWTGLATSGGLGASLPLGQKHPLRGISLGCRKP